MREAFVELMSAERREAEVVAILKRVIADEARALATTLGCVDASYAQAVELMLACTGKIIVTGVGKSGLIARKIAATMTSTGTRAVYLHPTEAMHGDLGIVTADDLVLAIGKSGESEELVAVLPAVRRLGAKIVAITARLDSSLGRFADLALFMGAASEACEGDVVPTCSTTQALAIGDALALALMQLRGFDEGDFARFHPGGRLGKRLLYRVSDLMIDRADVPVLDPDVATIEAVIVHLTKDPLGIVLFSRDGRTLAGVLTDGDIRRMLSQHRAGVFDLAVAAVMNQTPLTIGPDVMAVDALRFMEDRARPLNVVPVIAERAIVGLVRLHELLRVT